MTHVRRLAVGGVLSGDALIAHFACIWALSNIGLVEDSLAPHNSP